MRTSRKTARLLEAATGETVEIIPRVIWPSAQLPDIIDGWMERYSPDIVLFQINGFWYLYASVPLLFERKLGRVGKQISRAGLRAGRTPWIVKTRVFHFGRRVALRTIGGAHYFTPAEVCEIVEACLRRIVRHEGAGLIVQGQFAPSTWAAPRPAPSPSSTARSAPSANRSTSPTSPRTPPAPARASTSGRRATVSTPAKKATPGTPAGSLPPSSRCGRRWATAGRRPGVAANAGGGFAPAHGTTP